MKILFTKLLFRSRVVSHTIMNIFSNLLWFLVTKTFHDIQVSLKLFFGAKWVWPMMKFFWNKRVDSWQSTPCIWIKSKCTNTCNVYGQPFDPRRFSSHILILIRCLKMLIIAISELLWINCSILYLWFILCVWNHIYLHFCSWDQREIIWRNCWKV